MAYESSSRLIKCGVCEGRDTYFHMVESFRPAHQRDECMTLEEVEGKAPPTGKRGRRICNCLLYTSPSPRDSTSS
eukprot:11659873-Prorocentrum_lima.AAC.1